MAKRRILDKSSGIAHVCLALLLRAAVLQAVGANNDQAYTEPQVYGMRPNPRGEQNLGPIGVTGIRARIYKGLRVTVDSVDPNTPAQGKLSKGDVILGVNGVALKGKNALVVLGTALTSAEATNGILTFEIRPAGEQENKQVTVKIPVLGAYSKTFPLNCAKSTKIIKDAAAFYARDERMKEHQLWNALACLFLLSTGDDQYVPRVKAYFGQFLDDDGGVTGIGEHSWFNGYNGVACAEYYLRSGDKSVLPILQYYCDDARDRQKYGVGWGHWGYGSNPAYEAGGGMQHAAGNQMLLTLLLGKMCGVEVDDKTLNGALKHWYRFVGHGAIPIADQRYWHIFRSAGRDGATAAVMQIASQASSDVTIYERAKEYLAMSALTSWPSRSWNWEVYWHSVAGQFMLDYNPDMYYRTMQRFRWRYDLGRQPSGAFFWPENSNSIDDTEAGISLALAYTAPLRNLQITGAPHSKHAKKFMLPEHLWGTKADLAFHTSKHHPDFYKYGEEEEIHIPFWKLPVRLRYSPADVKELPLDMLRKNARHARSAVRTGAAKALCMNGHYDQIEALLNDPDPRLKRAGLDGLNDSRPWFTGPVVGKYALKAEDYTPGMIKAINGMMRNPEESWFVIDGALNALNHAPIEVIQKNIPLILPWRKHEDWWLRESAFMALMGLQKDEECFVAYLPTIIDIMIKEYDYNPRHKMVVQLQEALKTLGNHSPAGELIVAGLTRATMESEVRADTGRYERSREGTANVVEAALAAIKHAPESAPVLAETLATSGRLDLLDTGRLMELVKAKDGHLSDRFVGLYPALEKLPDPQKRRVVDALFDGFRPELIKRLESAEKPDGKLLDMIVDLTRLKTDSPGWRAIGNPPLAQRTFRFCSIDPLKEEEKLHPRIGAPKRLREITLPAALKNWYMPGFDDSSWPQGKTPIGIGVFTAHGHGRGWTATPHFSYTNSAAWGEGEFLLARTTFEVSGPDFDYYRIKILADQGYHIYLNGQNIHTYVWFQHIPHYRQIMLGEQHTKHLRKGKNTLAVYCNARFEKDKATEKYHPVGQLDIYIEGLKRSDIGL